MLRWRDYALGVERWLISERTVALIPVLDAAYGPRPIGVHIPRALMKPTVLGNEPWQWLGLVLGIGVTYVVGRGAASGLVWLALTLARRTTTSVDDALIRAARRPLRVTLAALIYRAWLGPLQLTESVLETCEHLVYTTFVLGVTWLLSSALRVWVLLLDERAARDGYDEFRSRRERTQAALLRRIASITIGFVSVTVVLLQFEEVRSIGVSLLASAGVLGVVVGFAAQKSLGTIVGRHPVLVRAACPGVNDHVVVENQFGEVEEINSRTRGRPRVGQAPAHRPHHVLSREAVRELDPVEDGPHRRDNVPGWTTLPRSLPPPRGVEA